MEKRLKRAYVEITNICNLECSFCPITEREHSVMAVDKFRETIQQVSPLAEQVCLHLMGEPLAHPNFPQILEICDEYQLQLQLTTNGLLLKKYTDLVLGSQTIKQVNISLQAYLDNYPDRPLEDYLDQIASFIELSVKKRPELYLNLRLWNINDGETSDHTISNERIFRYLEGRFQIEINRVVEVSHIKSKKLFERVYLHFDSRFEWPRLELPNNGTLGRCHGLINQVGIHADGSVVPCCLDDQKIINLGNVFEDSLNNILNSKRAVAIADGFRQNKLVEDLCQRCDYITRFKK